MCTLEGLGLRVSRVVTWRATGLSNYLSLGLVALLIIPLDGLRGVTPMISRGRIPIISSY